MRYAVTSSSAATCGRSASPALPQGFWPVLPAGRLSRAARRIDYRRPARRPWPRSRAAPGCGSKLLAPSSATDCGFTRYFSYRSSMKVALGAVQVRIVEELTHHVCHGLSLADGLTVAFGRAW